MKTYRCHARRIFTALTTLTLITAGGALSRPPAQAADPSSVVIAADFQTKAGCTKDWDPACSQTQMEKQGKFYSKKIKVPQGDWNFKVVLDKNWDTSYGAPGKGYERDNVPLKLAADAELEFIFDPESHHIGLRPTQITTGDHEVKPEDRELIKAPYRQNAAQNNFYFVLTDRFNNGDTQNDRGDASAEQGDRAQHGFDPTSKAFYHGGDIKGIIQKLDYIQGLGTTAIWLTPSFKNKAVQGTGNDASAGYHGYWITDFTQIDPHLGTNQDMKDLIKAAHEKGMKVYFDIVTNHTADLIQLAGGNGSNGSKYVSQQEQPYKDVNGKEFRLEDYAGKDASEFPKLNEKSFPYTPQRTNPAEKMTPDWLNDVTLYHNRGNSMFDDGGESVIMGDFFGLDDLMTEHPTVVDGMTKIYNEWVDYGLDGFRIDTVKHVDLAFWKQWTERVHQHAVEKGMGDFFMFGEAYNFSPEALSPFVRETHMDAVLDFAFQNNAVDFAKGGDTNKLKSLFYGDDWYTTTRSDAAVLPTFLGNHDMGRIGSLLQNSGDGAERLRRDQLAHALLYLTRGQPVVYYGDEQGFAGKGADKDARQDMFATKVTDVHNEQLVNGDQFGTGDHFNSEAPVAKTITELAKLRKENKALVEGAQIERYATQGAGIYAFSRVNREEKQEYLVALNNATTTREVDLNALTPNAEFERVYISSIYGNEAPTSLTTDNEAKTHVTVPGLTAVVYKVKNGKQVTGSVSGGLNIVGQELKGDAPIMTTVGGNAWSETNFGWRKLGEKEWNYLGTDTGQDARIFHNVRDLEPGTVVEYRTVTVDGDNKETASHGWGVVGVDLAVDSRALSVSATTASATVPAAVVAGNFTKDLGCTGGQEGNWDPTCAAAELRDDSSGWKTAELTLKPGEYEYKIATGGSWDQSYGALSGGTRESDEGIPDGKNVKFQVTQDKQKVTFFYHPETHEFFNTAEHRVITLPGTMGGALECPANVEKSDAYGNWGPACLATMLTRTGAHTYGTRLPKVPTPGNYEVKVAYDRDWQESYGPDGRSDSNYLVTVAESGKVLSYKWDEQTKKLTWTTSDQGASLVGDAAMPTGLEESVTLEN
ncbi:alpha-amylase family glycosyl hydrolase [Corynebacterium ramonii]|uniref:1,4-alpha-glucan-branching enzyme n=1 Tax=Corynebacterium ramonii TaxID=3026968 RepID=A0ABN4EBT3_9CORY|nr:alpha-amylase family glycosyl hydrolase [Corynebacterium ramonii]AIU31700.1 1,4-alpha-glucan-branching enzyme [Corynebacterium ramonii FRC0011]